MNYFSLIYFLLILYTLISLGLISFVIIYQVYLKHQNNNQQANKIKWMLYFQNSILHPKEGHSLKIEARVWRKLRNIKTFIHFPDAFAAYLNGSHRDKFIQVVEFNLHEWIKLGAYYSRKPSLEKAYYASVCNRMPVSKHENYHVLADLLLTYLDDPSIYCKENVLKALYHFGLAKPIVSALHHLSGTRQLHDPKLISDGLLTYSGDKTELIEQLYDELPYFQTDYQIALINFFRLEPAAEILKDRLITLINDHQTNIDLTCAVLRYYTKFPVTAYQSIIIACLEGDEYELTDWEPRSVAASALVSYPSPETVEALIRSIYSKHWYVRRNSAQALAVLKVPLEELSEVFEGDDSYAKNQLNYFYRKQVSV